MRCLLFCFKDVLQTDLDSVKNHWNTHYIRKSRHDTIPGRPAELYYLPENNGFQDFKFAVTAQQLDDMGVYCEMPDEDNIYDEYFNYVVEIQDLQPPTKWRQALLLFENLMYVAGQRLQYLLSNYYYLLQNNVRPVLNCPRIKHSGANKL